MDLAQIKSLIDTAREKTLFRRLIKLVQVSVIAGVSYYLTRKVAAIGWQDVMSALPTTPWFYLCLLGMYFAHPIGEWLVYRTLWGAPVARRLDVFLRMRVYNAAVMSYSGEAYLGLWANKNLDLRKRSILAKIKDSQILSALSSNSLTIALVVLLFMSGKLGIFTGADPSYPTYVAVALGLGLVLIPLVIWFRKQILSLEPAVARRVFMIHFSRLAIVVGLQVASWSVVLPDVPMNIWLVFLTGQYVLTRIPFLPNSDLLVAGLGLTLLSFVDAPPAALAGIFVASGALAQVAHLAVFAGLTVRDILRKTPPAIMAETKVSAVETRS